MITDQHRELLRETVKTESERLSKEVKISFGEARFFVMGASIAATLVNENPLDLIRRSVNDAISTWKNRP